MSIVSFLSDVQRLLIHVHELSCLRKTPAVGKILVSQQNHPERILCETSCADLVNGNMAIVKT